MKRDFYLGMAIGLGVLSFSSPVMAQVSSDGTLPTPTLVPSSVNGRDFLINNGTRSGNNLFHSFSQFSIPTNGSAIFNNATDVQTIFSRITGPQVSNIDGILKTQGSASLFLMNPNGIIFGPNAQLQLGGSFLGTTANSIKFANGIEFNTVNTTPALLSVNLPIGLQMGNNPGSIQLQGAKLQAPDAKTLGFIGGDITQTGGELRVNGGNGRIELAAIGENNTVGLTRIADAWAVDTSTVQNFRDLQVLNKGMIISKGEGSASITAVGRNLTVQDESSVQSYNEGSSNGGGITFKGSSAILVQNKTDIRTDVDGSGNAGDLRISAPSIKLNNSGSIVSVAWSGTGNGGNIFVTGKDVLAQIEPAFLAANGPDNTSGFVTVTFDQGQSGNINVTADNLTFSNKGGIGNVSIGAGNSGTTTLISKNLRVDSESGLGSTAVGTGAGGDVNIITDSFFMDGSSGFATGSYADDGGNAGNIKVTARSIIARDDSGFSSDTTGIGKAGNISLNADYIELSDTQINSRTQGKGNAGTIEVTAQILKILNGGQLNVSTKDLGNAGSITVNAKEVELSGEYTNGTLANKNTGIISSVLRNPDKPNVQTGNGGNIILNSESLMIRDGAFITASTSAGQGSGGNIELSTDRLNLLNGGQIMNITRSAGNAGSIIITARDQFKISGQDPLYIARQAAYIPNQQFSDVEYNLGPSSGIYASTTPLSTGSGGSLQIIGKTVQLQDQARVSVSSQGTGGAGNLKLNADRLMLDRQSNLQAESVAGNQGNIMLSLSEALILRRGSTITTTATGKASGGNIFIQSPALVGFENSDIVANALRGRGGNIKITTQSVFGLQYRTALTAENDITASSEFGINGNVQVNTIGINPTNALNALPVDVVDSSRQIADRCGVAKNSSFVATGRGGIPQTPTKTQKTDRTWNDLRFNSLQASALVNPIVENQSQSIIEASAFSVDRSGEISLISPKTADPQPTATCGIGGSIGAL